MSDTKNSQKAAGHMPDLKHVTGRNQEIKFPENMWRVIEKI